MTNPQEVQKKAFFENSMIAGQVEAPKFRTISLVDGEGKVKPCGEIFRELNSMSVYLTSERGVTPHCVVLHPVIDKGGRNDVNTGQIREMGLTQALAGNLQLFDDGVIAAEQLSALYWGRSVDELRADLNRQIGNFEHSKWMTVKPRTQDEIDKEVLSVPHVSSFGRAAASVNVFMYDEQVDYAPTAVYTAAGFVTMGLAGCIPTEMPASLPTAEVISKTVTNPTMEAPNENSDDLVKNFYSEARTTPGYIAGSETIFKVVLKNSDKEFRWLTYQVIGSDGKPVIMVGAGIQDGVVTKLNCPLESNEGVGQDGKVKTVAGCRETDTHGTIVVAIIEGDTLTYIAPDGVTNWVGTKKIGEKDDPVGQQIGFWTVKSVEGKGLPTEMPTILPTADPTATTEPTQEATPTPAAAEVVVNYENIADVPLENRLFTRGPENVFDENNPVLETGLVDIPSQGFVLSNEENSKVHFGETGVKFEWLSGIVMDRVIFNEQTGNLTIPLGIERPDGSIVTINVTTHVGTNSEDYSLTPFTFVSKRGLGAYPGFDVVSASLRSEAFPPNEVQSKFSLSKQIVLEIPNSEDEQTLLSGYTYLRSTFPVDFSENSKIYYALDFAEANAGEALEILRQIKDGTVADGAELNLWVYTFQVPELGD